MRWAIASAMAASKSETSHCFLSTAVDFDAAQDWLEADIPPDADLARIGDHEDLRKAQDRDAMDSLNLDVALSQNSGRKIPAADTAWLYPMRRLGLCLASPADPA